MKVHKKVAWELRVRLSVWAAAANATESVKTSGQLGAPASAGPCLEAGGAEEGPIRCGSCMKG